MSTLTPFDHERFYLGALCKNGHEFAGTGKTLRYKSGRHCPECSKLTKKVWGEKNPHKATEYAKAFYETEHGRAYRRSWQEKNREAENERHRIWRANNPSKARANVKKSYYKHQPKRLAARREYGKRNRDQEGEYSKEWALKHPLRIKERSAVLRGKALGVVVDEAVSYGRIYKRDRGICHVCNEKVSKDVLVFDHITPMSLGGPHLESNIKVAHYACNRDRKDGRPRKPT